MSLDAERWLAAEAIFHEALHTREPARTCMLTARFKGDSTLMEELRSLLAVCEAEELDRLTAGAKHAENGRF